MNSQRAETVGTGPVDILLPYPDGRWWVIDHLPTPRFPLVCRGNTGEVFPNVVTPLTGSIFNVPYLRGQARLSLEFGMVTQGQLTHFDGIDGAITAVFGGYLYGNVSLARSATTRTPRASVINATTSRNRHSSSSSTNSVVATEAADPTSGSLCRRPGGATPRSPWRSSSVSAIRPPSAIHTEPEPDWQPNAMP
jgi:hypothetical protein